MGNLFAIRDMDEQYDGRYPLDDMDSDFYLDEGADTHIGDDEMSRELFRRRWTAGI
ncbi:hypothetical protein [Paludifilum halophilum]|nr:hypothetical protein [Paludifilum halophilum]